MNRSDSIPPPLPNDAPALASATPCPDHAIWFDVAGGTLDEEAASVPLRHAVSCAECAHHLKLALALFDPTESAEERLFLDSLPISQPGGQSRIIACLEKNSGSTGVLSWASRVPIRAVAQARFALPLAALLLLAAYIGYHVHQNAHDRTLLATAYSLDRPSELRIPGSAASPLVSPTRGSNRPVESSELLELKMRAQHQFAKDPNNAALRQTLGQIALVEHDGETARRDFEMAEVLNPKLAQLKLDLGSAYFELAESNHQPLDYARAIDFFGQYLSEVHGKDPVALYDRGLCWQRQAVYSQAQSDFQAALALENDAGWRREIQTHLDQVLRDQASDPEKAAHRAAFSPAALLASTHETPGLYEIALAAATSDWLPRRANAPRSRTPIDAALDRTAQLGRAHHDAWMTDMLAAPPTPAEHQAEAALARALQATAKGESDTIFAAATEAMAGFKAVGNSAGFLRAAVERVYSLHQLGRPKEGLAEAQALLADRRLVRYPWLRTDLLLEDASANGMLGDTGSDALATVQAASLARSNDLPLYSLRTALFSAEQEQRQRHLARAWMSATTAIQDSYSLPGSALRRAQLLGILADIANDLHLTQTRTGLGAAAAADAVTAGNLTTAAYLSERLAVDQLETEDSAGAARSFHEADTLLRKIGPGPAAEYYHTDWQIDRSAFEAQTHSPAIALADLAPLEPRVHTSSAHLMQIDFYTQLAGLLYQSHRINDSLQQAWIAVTASEEILTTKHTAGERTAWKADADRAYRMLALDLAASGRPELALRAWEWLRSAPYRTPRAFPPDAPVSSFASLVSPLPAQLPGHLTLVYAELNGHYVVWTIGAGTNPTVHLHTLPATSDQIRTSARALLRLCSDPHSSIVDINVLGTTLDQALLAPLGDELDHAEGIDLDLDPSLAEIPFAVIRHHGGYFGLEHRLLYLPEDWSLAASPPESDELETAPHLLVLRESPESGKALIPDAYDESITLAQRFAGTRVEQVALARSGPDLQVTGPSTLPLELAEADIVHYTGHGLDDRREVVETSAPTQADPGPRTASFALAPAMLHHCRLAVLAACQTSREREENAIDVPSFARILLAAGAARVLATQWDVDSRMTQGLMLRFYNELANHQTYLESLRRAQRAVESDTMSAHPYFWAAFQLVGHPVSPNQSPAPAH